MQPPFHVSDSLRTQSRLYQWALLALFAVISVVSLFQARLLFKSSATGSPIANSLAQTLQERMKGVSEGITSYLQNHDPKSLARISEDGREISRLLAESKDARFENAHAQIREATLSLLAVDQATVEARRGLNETRQSLFTLLTEEIQPAIKSNQLNSEMRLRAIRSAIREAQKLSENQDSESALNESRARFRRSIVAYEELSRTRRAQYGTEKAAALFDRGLARMKDLQEAKKKMNFAMDRFAQNRSAFVLILQDSHSSKVLGIRKESVKETFTSGLAYILLNGLLLLVGMVLVLGAYRRSEERLVRPMQDILQCVEAAASGDLTRTPDHWARDEVGQLAQAVGRLISVLSRSENLVYHLAALVESSGEAIISHTLDGTILSWNKGAQKMYGYSAEEVKGRSIVILTPENGDPELMRSLESVRRGEKVQPFETVHVARNGRKVRALVRVSAILDSTREPIGASFCAQDLTGAHVRSAKAVEGSQVV